MSFFQDKVPARRFLVVPEFHEKTKTTVLLQPPYLPDFSSCDFFLFSELARYFQGRRIQSPGKIKCASQAELKALAKNGFRRVSITFNDNDKSVFLRKILILKEDVLE